MTPVKYVYYLNTFRVLKIEGVNWGPAGRRIKKTAKNCRGFNKIPA